MIVKLIQPQFSLVNGQQAHCTISLEKRNKHTSKLPLWAYCVTMKILFGWTLAPMNMLILSCWTSLIWCNRKYNQCNYTHVMILNCYWWAIVIHRNMNTDVFIIVFTIQQLLSSFVIKRRSGQSTLFRLGGGAQCAPLQIFLAVLKRFAVGW